MGGDNSPHTWQLKQTVVQYKGKQKEVTNMEILELKNGSVDINNIDTYNELKKKLDFLRARLNCVTHPRFKKEYFIMGGYDSGSYENKDYIILSDNRSNLDSKLKQEVIDFLTTKFIEQMNEVIKQMNELIK